MVKKQQMQWTPRGAHLLLQVRTQVLNEDWDNTFRRWYPHFRPTKASSTPLSSSFHEKLTTTERAYRIEKQRLLVGTCQVVTDPTGPDTGDAS